MPHKRVLDDGRTAYYDGVTLWPIFLLNADGTGYFGWHVCESEELLALIGRADKRVRA